MLSRIDRFAELVEQTAIEEDIYQYKFTHLSKQGKLLLERFGSLENYIIVHAFRAAIEYGHQERATVPEFIKNIDGFPILFFPGTNKKVSKNDFIIPLINLRQLNVHMKDLYLKPKHHTIWSITDDMKETLTLSDVDKFMDIYDRGRCSYVIYLEEEIPTRSGLYLRIEMSETEREQMEEQLVFLKMKGEDFETEKFIRQHLREKQLL